MAKVAAVSLRDIMHEQAVAAPGGGHGAASQRVLLSSLGMSDEELALLLAEGFELGGAVSSVDCCPFCLRFACVPRTHCHSSLLPTNASLPVGLYPSMGWQPSLRLL
jgi:hypothetical protein